jgi:hypothetical protein
MKNSITAAALAAACLLAAPFQAAAVTLDLEGVADNADVGNFYNGGAGGNYGVTFSENAVGLIDFNDDLSGTGNFANEPSGKTVLSFLNEPTSSYINVAAGFTTAFSLFYSSADTGIAYVFDGLNTTGNLLGSFAINAQHDDNGCVGDSNGSFCNWSIGSVSFSGTARSIGFSVNVGQAIYDNVTFGSSRPGAGTGVVPEPTTWALLLIGFGGVGWAIRRRTRALGAAV